jgi:hypothetical protein
MLDEDKVGPFWRAIAGMTESEAYYCAMVCAMVVSKNLTGEEMLWHSRQAEKAAKAILEVEETMAVFAAIVDDEKQAR